MKLHVEQDGTQFDKQYSRTSLFMRSNPHELAVSATCGAACTLSTICARQLDERQELLEVQPLSNPASAGLRLEHAPLVFAVPRTVTRREVVAKISAVEFNGGVFAL